MKIQRVLFATDFSEAGEAAFPVAVSVARDNKAELTILYVSDHEDYPVGELVDEEPSPPRTEADQLEALVQRVEGVNCKSRWIHREMPHHADAIVEVAKQEHADMIVIGTHGRSGVMHMLMGSVAEQLIREAPCPVLCVRHETQTT